MIIRKVWEDARGRKFICIPNKDAKKEGIKKENYVKIIKIKNGDV